MRRSWRTGLSLGFFLAAASQVSAGLYDPSHPTTELVSERGVRALPYELFRDALNDVRNIGDSVRTPKARAVYLDRREALLKRGQASLSATELVELAFVQQRLRQSDDALKTLRQAQSRDQRSFWVQADLGAVYQAMNQLQEAAPIVTAARDSFPKPWPGGEVAGEWFTKVERYQAELLKLRLREGGGRAGGRRAVPVHEVDDLFSVKFVGPSGQYEAGKIADAEKAKLPAEAEAIVQQLILWFPDDTRLLWLLGELYNANGDLDSAFAVFQRCVEERSYDSPTLRERRKLVKVARDALAQQRDALAQQKQAAAKEAEQPRESVIPDNGTLWTVGAISGTIFVALAWWQFRELIRRLRKPSRASS
jgi:tetratricopeptide (TPR) repeat protein